MTIHTNIKNTISKNIQAALTDDAKQSVESRKLSVMVVEDNDSERWRLIAMLAKLGYEVSEAAGGDEALALQLSNAADLIVSDWQMPGMDGLQLCRTMKTESDYESPYFIMLTGKTNPVDLIAGMDAGADDFVVKPATAEELRVRVQAGARIQCLRYEQENISRLMRELLLRERRSMRQMRDELAMAGEVQQDLLPSASARFEDVAVRTLFQPADAVGGDFFNYFRLGPHYLGFYLLDVSGHGVASAMTSFSIAYQLTGDTKAGSLLMCQGEEGSEPAAPSRVVAELNARFQDRNDRGRHFTMVYGVLDLLNGQGTLCQAGHPHPLMLTAGGPVKQLGEGGFPVGLFPDAEYQDTAFELQPGSQLFICSDGVLDHLAEQHGVKAGNVLSESLSLGAQETADTAIQLLEGLLGEAPREGSSVDDISALVISRDAK